MGEIHRRFIQFQEKYPDLGDVIIMCYVVKGQGYSREVIDKSFTRLVDREQYVKSEKIELIDFLVIQTLVK